MVDSAMSMNKTVGEFLEIHPHDRAAINELRRYNAEACPDCGVHPDVWSKRKGGNPNAVIAEWVFCRVCELVAQAQAAGPPTEVEGAPGWRLTLKHTHQ